jgi:hypothetical protein
MIAGLEKEKKKKEEEIIRLPGATHWGSGLSLSHRGRVVGQGQAARARCCCCCCCCVALAALLC